MEEEKVLRKKSQVFVFDCCKVLQTKSLVMCAAMTICQRYFSQVSFRKINRVVSHPCGYDMYHMYHTWLCKLLTFTRMAMMMVFFRYFPCVHSIARGNVVAETRLDGRRLADTPRG